MTYVLPTKPQKIIEAQPVRDRTANTFNKYFELHHPPAPKNTRHTATSKVPSYCNPQSPVTPQPPKSRHTAVKPRYVGYYGLNSRKVKTIRELCPEWPIFFFKKSRSYQFLMPITTNISRLDFFRMKTGFDQIIDRSHYPLMILR